MSASTMDHDTIARGKAEVQSAWADFGGLMMVTYVTTIKPEFVLYERPTDQQDTTETMASRFAEASSRLLQFLSNPSHFDWPPGQVDAFLWNSYDIEHALHSCILGVGRTAALLHTNQVDCPDPLRDLFFVLKELELSILSSLQYLTLLGNEVPSFELISHVALHGLQKVSALAKLSEDPNPIRFKSLVSLDETLVRSAVHAARRMVDCQIPKKLFLRSDSLKSSSDIFSLPNEVNTRRSEIPDNCQIWEYLPVVTVKEVEDSYALSNERDRILVHPGNHDPAVMYSTYWQVDGTKMARPDEQQRDENLQEARYLCALRARLAESLSELTSLHSMEDFSTLWATNSGGRAVRQAAAVFQLVFKAQTPMVHSILCGSRVSRRQARLLNSCFRASIAEEHRLSPVFMTCTIDQFKRIFPLSGTLPEWHRILYGEVIENRPLRFSPWHYFSIMSQAMRLVLTVSNRIYHDLAPLLKSKFMTPHERRHVRCVIEATLQHSECTLWNLLSSIRYSDTLSLSSAVQTCGNDSSQGGTVGLGGDTLSSDRTYADLRWKPLGAQGTPRSVPILIHFIQLRCSLYASALYAMGEALLEKLNSRTFCGGSVVAKAEGDYLGTLTSIQTSHLVVKEARKLPPRVLNDEALLMGGLLHLYHDIYEENLASMKSMHNSQSVLKIAWDGRVDASTSETSIQFDHFAKAHSACSSYFLNPARQRALALYGAFGSFIPLPLPPAPLGPEVLAGIPPKLRKRPEMVTPYSLHPQGCLMGLLSAPVDRGGIRGSIVDESMITNAVGVMLFNFKRILASSDTDHANYLIHYHLTTIEVNEYTWIIDKVNNSLCINTINPAYTFPLSGDQEPAIKIKQSEDQFWEISNNYTPMILSHNDVDTWRVVDSIQGILVPSHDRWVSQCLTRERFRIDEPQTGQTFFRYYMHFGCQKNHNAASFHPLMSCRKRELRRRVVELLIICSNVSMPGLFPSGRYNLSNRLRPNCTALGEEYPSLLSTASRPVASWPLAATLTKKQSIDAANYLNRSKPQGQRFRDALDLVFRSLVHDPCIAMSWWSVGCMIEFLSIASPSSQVDRVLHFRTLSLTCWMHALALASCQDVNHYWGHILELALEPVSSFKKESHISDNHSWQSQWSIGHSGAPMASIAKQMLHVHSAVRTSLDFWEMTVPVIVAQSAHLRRSEGIFSFLLDVIEQSASPSEWTSVSISAMAHLLIQKDSEMPQVSTLTELFSKAAVSNSKSKGSLFPSPNNVEYMEELICPSPDSVILKHLAVLTKMSNDAISLDSLSDSAGDSMCKLHRNKVMVAIGMIATVAEALLSMDSLKRLTETSIGLVYRGVIDVPTFYQSVYSFLPKDRYDELLGDLNQIVDCIREDQDGEECSILSDGPSLLYCSLPTNSGFIKLKRSSCQFVIQSLTTWMMYFVIRVDKGYCHRNQSPLVAERLNEMNRSMSPPEDSTLSTESVVDIPLPVIEVSCPFTTPSLRSSKTFMVNRLELKQSTSMFLHKTMTVDDLAETLIIPEFRVIDHSGCERQIIANVSTCAWEDAIIQTAMRCASSCDQQRCACVQCFSPHPISESTQEDSVGGEIAMDSVRESPCTSWHAVPFPDKEAVISNWRKLWDVVLSSSMITTVIKVLGSSIVSKDIEEHLVNKLVSLLCGRKQLVLNSRALITVVDVSTMTELVCAEESIAPKARGPNDFEESDSPIFRGGYFDACESATMLSSGRLDRIFYNVDYIKHMLTAVQIQTSLLQGCHDPGAIMQSVVDDRKRELLHLQSSRSLIDALQNEVSGSADVDHLLKKYQVESELNSLHGPPSGSLVAEGDNGVPQTDLIKEHYIEMLGLLRVAETDTLPVQGEAARSFVKSILGPAARADWVGKMTSLSTAVWEMVAKIVGSTTPPGSAKVFMDATWLWHSKSGVILPDNLRFRSEEEVEQISGGVKSHRLPVDIRLGLAISDSIPDYTLSSKIENIMDTKGMEERLMSLRKLLYVRSMFEI
eukprot:GHVH01007189.1.p1 GENE.GHVH01007189.1~~GHVH01007189.1.p1  ORF type:complete len:2125 (-),score=306.27 GHVH01007189.1:93-6068(-)